MPLTTPSSLLCTIYVNFLLFAHKWYHPCIRHLINVMNAISKSVCTTTRGWMCVCVCVCVWGGGIRLELQFCRQCKQEQVVCRDAFACITMFKFTCWELFVPRSEAIGAGGHQIWSQYRPTTNQHPSTHWFEMLVQIDMAWPKHRNLHYIYIYVYIYIALDFFNEIWFVFVDIYGIPRLIVFT